MSSPLQPGRPSPDGDADPSSPPALPPRRSPDLRVPRVARSAAPTARPSAPSAAPPSRSGVAPHSDGRGHGRRWALSAADAALLALALVVLVLVVLALTR